MKSPHPPPPNKPDFDLDHLVPLKTHGHAHSTLGSTPQIFFGHVHVLGIFSTSSNKTLKLSPFLHQHSTFFHHFHLVNEGPNVKLTNKTKIVEREVFHHQPRRSLRLTKLQVTAIRKDYTLSQAKKRTLVGIAKGRIVMVDSRDNNIHAGRWYKKTFTRYLVDISHQFSGPANSNSESDLE